MYLQGSHHCGGSGQMLQTAIDNRIKRASHETSDDSLYLLDLVMVGAVTHFFFLNFLSQKWLQAYKERSQR